MTHDKKTLKFQMMMSPNEAKELDDWMFKNRLRSRAEAIRRLVAIGIQSHQHFGLLRLADTALTCVVDELGIDPSETIGNRRGINGRTDVTIGEAQQRIAEFMAQRTNGGAS